MIICDIGGYRGDWTWERLLAGGVEHAHIYEPVAAWADAIRSRFTGWPVTIHQCALWGFDATGDLVGEDDATSIVVNPLGQGAVTLRQASDALPPGEIGLVKINCEGGEYSIVPELGASGRLREIEELRIQFHSAICGAADKYAVCAAILSLTHNCWERDPFVWETWRRR